MKITIILNSGAVTKIKYYLKETSDIKFPTKKDIQHELQSFIDSEYMQGMFIGE